MTTVGTILTAALDRLVLFDKGLSDIGNDDTALFGIVNRHLASLYADAARPPVDQENDRDDYLAVSATLPALNASLQATLPAYAWVPRIRDAAHRPIRITTRAALDRGLGELPPAVWIRHLTLTSAGRAGDPVQGDVLTAHYTPLPGTLTDRAHHIGATTPTDAATSAWPAHVGDAWLVHDLAVYLAVKSGDADPTELQGVVAERDAFRTRLLDYLRTVE